MNRQHWAGGFADDFFRDAAEQHVGQARAAVRADYDQVDVLLFRIADNFQKRHAGADGANDLLAGGPLRVGDFLERLGDAGFHFIETARRHDPRIRRVGRNQRDILYDAENVQLRLVLLGETARIELSFARRVAEVGGEEDLLHCNHGSTMWVVGCGWWVGKGATEDGCLVEVSSCDRSNSSKR